MAWRHGLTLYDINRLASICLGADVLQVHGGIISAMLLLAARRHVDKFYRHPDFVLDPDTFNIDINFMEPVHPEDIYSILVPPAQIEGPVTEDGNHRMQLKCSPVMMQLTTAPQISVEVDQLAKGETHFVTVPKSGMDVINATATVQCKLLPRASSDVEPR